MAEHKGAGGYGQTHAWDCPACVEAAEAHRARHEETNPHRPGTKAHAQRAREDAAARMGCDPRTETYWSM